MFLFWDLRGIHKQTFITGSQWDAPVCHIVLIILNCVLSQSLYLKLIMVWILLWTVKRGGTGTEKDDEGSKLVCVLISLDFSVSSTAWCWNTSDVKVKLVLVEIVCWTWERTDELFNQLLQKILNVSWKTENKHKSHRINQISLISPLSWV